MHIDTLIGQAARLHYETRRRQFEEQRQKAQGRWSLVANARLAAFVALAVTLWFALRSGEPVPWFLVAVLVFVAGGLVAWHGKLRQERDRLAAMVAVNANALARLHLAWGEMPDPPSPAIANGHPYARDLDITGSASLLRRIATPVMPTGLATLQRWLLAAAPLPDIRARQEAVRELAQRLDLRQAVEAAGHGRAEPFPEPEPFLAWSEAEGWLTARRWLTVVAVASPLAFVVTGALFLTGFLAWPLWLVPAAINVAVFQFAGSRVTAELAKIAPVQAVSGGYATLFAEIAAAGSQARMLRDIDESLEGAAAGMRRLARITGFVVPRGSILWVPLQIALLWDINVLHAIERWRSDPAVKPRQWFGRAGEWEALAALSVLAHDFPEWAFPLVDPALDRIEAHGIVHPLLPPGEAVANDASVGPRGTFLFITGSNMSGKSTLLRAVGINAALALAGGPVGASRMSLPPVEIWTCMRVEDSLARGVSFFMAELQRLKAVVDAATAGTERPVLALLDEILQGTNTAERQIASRQVLAQLAAGRGFTAVTSHDLGLVEGSELASTAVCMHFAETFSRDGDVPSMTFDYRLREGLATSTNALALMELLGFDVPTAPAEHGVDGRQRGTENL